MILNRNRGTLFGLLAKKHGAGGWSGWWAQTLEEPRRHEWGSNRGAGRCRSPLFAAGASPPCLPRTSLSPSVNLSFGGSPLPFSCPSSHSFCPVSTPSSPILQLLTSARNVFITSLYILIYRKHILETHCHRATFCSLSLSSLRAYYNWLCSPNFLKLRSYLSRVLLKSCLVDFFLICCLCMIPEREKKNYYLTEASSYWNSRCIFLQSDLFSSFFSRSS